eukprot:778327-Pleurochrysis_carterae.AAC.1
MITPAITRNYWTEPTWDYPRNPSTNVDHSFQAAYMRLLVATNMMVRPVAEHGMRSFDHAAKIVGGGTMINFAAYIRGGNGSLRALGPGWEPEVLVPKFETMERDFLKLPSTSDEIAGMSEALTLAATQSGYTHVPLGRAAAAGVEAGAQVGAEAHAEAQAEAAEIEAAATRQVVSRLEVTIDANGRRISAASAFLTPQVRALHNFQLITGAAVTRVLMEGNRATGVAYTMVDGEAGGGGGGGGDGGGGGGGGGDGSGGEGGDGGRVHERRLAALVEVVLCAGTMRSPQLLMLSGIGPREVLDQHKVPVVIEAPAVGQNMVNHLHVPIKVRYLGGMRQLCKKLAKLGGGSGGGGAECIEGNGGSVLAHLSSSRRTKSGTASGTGASGTTASGIGGPNTDADLHWIYLPQNQPPGLEEDEGMLLLSQTSGVVTRGNVTLRSANARDDPVLHGVRLRVCVRACE